MIALSFLWVNSNAHGVEVSNVSVTGNDITFDISFKNSWTSYANTGVGSNPNYPCNRSGIWVFLKVQSNVTNEWTHQKVSTTAANHNVVTPNPVIGIFPSNDGVGVMLHHSSSASSFSTFSTRLKLQMDAVPIGQLNFKVFGIEMVESNLGGFYVGDGYFTERTLDTVSVTSSIIPADAFVHSSSPVGSSHPAINSSYPTGYSKTNCMRYECTNEQYVEFLNTLTYDQQRALTDASPDAAANTNAFNFETSLNNTLIKIKTPGINNLQPAVYACDYNGNNIYYENGDGQNQAFENATVKRVLSYLDWSGLRLMSELEYEKFCRGSSGNGLGGFLPRPRVEREYAWGNDSIIGINIADASNVGMDNERYVGPSGMGRAVCRANPISSQNFSSPMRVGQFAGASTGREASGASYWGIMDMTGNVSELCYDVFYSTQVLSRSDYGDGIISNNSADMGEHNVNGWPSSTNSAAYVLRGGSCTESITSVGGFAGTSRLMVSHRNKNSNTFQYLIEPRSTNNYPYYVLGIRGVRATD